MSDLRDHASAAGGRQLPHIVLVVDGLEDRDYYERLLREAGFIVTPAADCDTGVEQIVHGTANMLLAVFQRTFPGTCLAACRGLRLDAPRVPIILAAFDVTDEDLRAASDAGALGVRIPRHDGVKLVAVVKGIFAAGRAAPVKAELRRPEDRRGFN